MNSQRWNISSSGALSCCIWSFHIQLDYPDGDHHQDESDSPLVTDTPVSRGRRRVRGSSGWNNGGLADCVLRMDRLRNFCAERLAVPGCARQNMKTRVDAVSNRFGTG